jgi:hypothetical protein
MIHVSTSLLDYLRASEMIVKKASFEKHVLSFLSERITNISNVDWQKPYVTKNFCYGYFLLPPYQKSSKVLI